MTGRRLGVTLVGCLVAELCMSKRGEHHAHNCKVFAVSRERPPPHTMTPWRKSVNFYVLSDLYGPATLLYAV